MVQRNRVFISYSHKDRDFFERLQVHLTPVERKGLVDVWADTKINAGDDWKQEIDNALQSASVAILLISADFLASGFIVNNELPQLLEAAETRGTRIVPVILKPCGFTRTPELVRFQTVNDPLKPVIKMSHGGREELWDKVASIVLDAVSKANDKNDLETVYTTHPIVYAIRFAADNKLDLAIKVLMDIDAEIARNFSNEYTSVLQIAQTDTISDNTVAVNFRRVRTLILKWCYGFANINNISTSFTDLDFISSHELKYKPGRRVFDTAFGEGFVLESHYNGEEEEVTIRFENKQHGIKQLSTLTHNLIIID